jgi:hypothetical protein
MRVTAATRSAGRSTSLITRAACRRTSRFRPVSGIFYLVLARTIDVEAETRIAQSEAERVERFAREHRSPAEAR